MQGQEPTGADRDVINELLRERRALREQLEGTGHYVLLPTAALTDRAEVYYNQYSADVARLLDTSGVDAYTSTNVVNDYRRLLAGVYNVTLPLDKQAKVVKTVKPWRLFLTERYGLNLLFGIYMYNTTAARDYVNGFKNANGRIETVVIRREDGKTDPIQVLPQKEIKDMIFAFI